jgi:hypothetical protein
VNRTDAAATLTALFPRGATVTTIITSVARSGMSRRIRVLAVDGERIRDVSPHVAAVLGWPHSWERGGILVRGAGMDMCFHTVYTLASKLYGDGYALDNRNI